MASCRVGIGGGQPTLRRAAFNNPSESIQGDVDETGREKLVNVFGGYSSFEEMLSCFRSVCTLHDLATAVCMGDASNGWQDDAFSCKQEEKERCCASRTAAFRLR